MPRASQQIATGSPSSSPSSRASEARRRRQIVGPAEHIIGARIGGSGNPADDGGRLVEQIVDPEPHARSEEHTSELQSLMSISYAVLCLNTTTKSNGVTTEQHHNHHTYTK